jgi:cation diffusion facilitator CzcD-associated flavoprotein CzcO
MSGALNALEAKVRHDLTRTSHPSAPWLEAKIGPDGRPALDVLIVGGGQSGLATAFGLRRSQVTNILIIDKAEAGKEGPWLSYARMQTLRSPKDFTGPDLDIPSLTYALTERVAGVTPWKSNIHVFAFASTMSFGPSGSSINAMTTAVPKLIYGLTRGLFRADVARHWNSFRAYDVPQAVVSRQDKAGEGGGGQPVQTA